MCLFSGRRAQQTRASDVRRVRSSVQVLQSKLGRTSPSRRPQTRCCLVSARLLVTAAVTFPRGTSHTVMLIDVSVLVQPCIDGSSRDIWCDVVFLDVADMQLIGGYYVQSIRMITTALPWNCSYNNNNSKFLVGFKSIRVAIFYAGLPKPNATLLFYPGMGPSMLRRLRRERVSSSQQRRNLPWNCSCRVLSLRIVRVFTMQTSTSILQMQPCFG